MFLLLGGCSYKRRITNSTNGYSSDVTTTPKNSINAYNYDDQIVKYQNKEFHFCPNAFGNSKIAHYYRSLKGHVDDCNDCKENHNISKIQDSSSLSPAGKDYQPSCEFDITNKLLKSSIRIKINKKYRNNNICKSEMKQYDQKANIYKILSKNHSFRNLNELLSLADRSKSFHDIKKGSRIGFNNVESIDILNYSKLSCGNSVQLKSFSPSNKYTLQCDKQYISLCDNGGSDFKLPLLSKEQDPSNKNMLKMQIKGNLRMNSYTNQYGDIPSQLKKSEIYK